MTGPRPATPQALPSCPLMLQGEHRPQEEGSASEINPTFFSSTYTQCAKDSVHCW